MVEPPSLPANLTAPCANPAALPASGMTPDQVKAAWARDRGALVMCRDQKAAIVAGIGQWSAAVARTGARK